MTPVSTLALARQGSIADLASGINGAVAASAMGTAAILALVLAAFRRSRAYPLVIGICATVALFSAPVWFLGFLNTLAVPHRVNLHPLQAILVSEIVLFLVSLIFPIRRPRQSWIAGGWVILHCAFWILVLSLVGSSWILLSDWPLIGSLSLAGPAALLWLWRKPSLPLRRAFQFGASLPRRLGSLFSFICGFRRGRAICGPRATSIP